MNLMKPYDEALREILENGTSRTNKRTGIKTLSVFGMTKRYNLHSDFFPILTRRKVWPMSVFHELLWFLSGSTNNNDLTRRGCNFWTPWVDAEFEQKHGFASGSFGPGYGFQLRHFGGEYGNGIGGDAFTEDHQDEGMVALADANVYGRGGMDQLSWIIDRIKQDHSCRRTLWTLWNPKDVEQIRLPPCHLLTQILVDDDRKLTLIMYQRSADFPIGVPANIQFYSALAVMIAQQTDCTPYEFVHMTADSHIYMSQIDSVKEYLALPDMPSPRIDVKKAASIFNYKIEDFTLSDFGSGPKVNIPLAI